MKDRVPSLYDDHWWHSFRSQVPGLIHTCSCRKRETEFDRTVTPAVDCWCHCLSGGDVWKWMNCEREEEGQSRDLSMIMIKKKGWTIHDKTNVKESHERQRDHTCRCMNNRYARQSLKCVGVCVFVPLSVFRERGSNKTEKFLYSIWDRQSRKTPHERETDRG